MAIDFSKPTTTRNYSTEFVSDLTNNITELSKWLDPSYVTITGTIPTGAKRLNSGVIEQYNGTAWATMSVGYLLKAGDTATGTMISTNAVGFRVVNTTGAIQVYKDGTPTKAARLAFNTSDTDGLSLGLYNGTTWTDYFRADASGYFGINGVPVNAIRQTIYGNTEKSLRVSNSSATPWAIELYRSDGTPSSSSVRNSGGVWSFEHTPVFAGGTAWHSLNLTNLNQLTNGPGYITGITSGMVTTALGYTPWHAGNDGVGSGLDADLLDGLSSATAATVNTIAARDASGYLYATYLNQSSSNAEAGTISQIMYNNGTDGFLRKGSIAQISAVLTPSWTNVSGRPTAVSAFTNDSGYVQASAGTFTSNITTTGTVTAQGLLYGRGGSKGYGQISTTTTAGTPTGGSSGDFVLVY